jgi:hypothetical protein
VKKTRREFIITFAASPPLNPAQQSLLAKPPQLENPLLLGIEMH